jgi:spermidine synthase
MLFCSGISALVYQVLWLRMLGWVFGVTTYAASAVWASFMAGLAIGSLAAGHIADRARRPLGWFGAAELLVGLSALCTPLALRALQHEYVALYPSLPHVLWALTLARFSMSFLALIVPATMMGASLPLAVRSADCCAGRLGERLGVLYGSNTAGAIIGTLGAGLFLIPALGIQRTFHVAAALNFLVGASALLLSWAVGSNRPVDEARPAARPRLVARTPMPAETRRAVALFTVLAVFALSGAVALALEVVWFRVLTLFLRPTVYGFAVMLAAVLSASPPAVTSSHRGWIATGDRLRCWHRCSSRWLSRCSCRFGRWPPCRGFRTA